MLLVKTKVRESTTHGLGLFADQVIPAGEEIWRFTPGFDQKFTRQQILALPKLLQIYLYTYVWKSKKSGLYIFAADSGKFFNHSEDPTCLSEYRENEEESLVTARRDIQPGEEMTDDYNTFEDVAGEDNLADIATKYHLVDELDPRFKKQE